MRSRHWVALVTSALLWSTSFPIIKVGLRVSTPVELVFLRFFFAGILGIGLLWMTQRREFLRVLFHPTVMALGGINALGFFLQFQGQAHTLAAKAALLVNMYVVFVGVIGYFVLGEKPRGYHYLALALALIGAGLTTLGPYGWREVLRSPAGQGDLFILGSAFVWAFYIVYSRKIAHAFPSTAIMAGVMWWTLVPLAVLYAIVDHRFQFAPKALGIGFYLAIFCSILPYSLYVFALKKVTAISSSIVLLLEIVWAVIWSFLFLGERFQWMEIWGSLLVLGAIVSLILFEARASSRGTP